MHRRGWISLVPGRPGAESNEQRRHTSLARHHSVLAPPQRPTRAPSDSFTKITMAGDSTKRTALWLVALAIVTTIYATTSTQPTNRPATFTSLVRDGDNDRGGGWDRHRPEWGRHHRPRWHHRRNGPYPPIWWRPPPPRHRYYPQYGPPFYYGQKESHPELEPNGNTTDVAPSKPAIMCHCMHVMNMTMPEASGKTGPPLSTKPPPPPPDPQEATPTNDTSG